MRKLILGMAVMIFGMSGFSVMAEEVEEAVIISWDEASAESFEDINLGEDIEVEDYATFSFPVSDFFYISEEESYVRLKMIIMNTQLKEAVFANTTAVKVIYDDKYEFAGEIQRIYNTDEMDIAGPLNTNEKIKPLYYGSYSVQGIVPKIVEESDKPLRIEFKVDDFEFVYHVRK